MKRWMTMLIAAALLAGAAGAQNEPTIADIEAPEASAATAPADDDEDELDAIETQLALIDASAPAAVRVLYTLRYDKGEQPRGGYGRGYRDSARAIEEDRPMEIQGYLVGPTTVVTPDVLMEPRFIESIEVVSAAPGAGGEQTRRVAATVSGYLIDQAGMLLTLAEPIEGAEPLAFVPDAEQPYYGMAYHRTGARWRVAIQPMSVALQRADDGEVYMDMHSGDVVLDEQGRPVGMALTDRIGLEGAWRGSPTEMPALSAEQYDQTLEQIEQIAQASAARVRLSFRSPRRGQQDPYSRYGGFGGDDAAQTERDVLGLIVEGQRVLILAELDAQTTARLERILVHPAEGEPVAATFEASLKDFGVIVASLDEPLGEPIELRTAPLTPLRKRLLPMAEVRVQGEQRTDYYMHTRITGFSIGWRGEIYPHVHGRTEGASLVFDPDNRLAALPVVKRPRPGQNSRGYYGGYGGYGGQGRESMTPAALLAEALAELPEHIDPDNIPLSEEQEARLAWLGVELQPMDQALARANEVSDLTGDGRFGALVSYVYPDSPAAEAGIDVGDILLRLHAPEYPQPIEVQVEHDRFGGRGFPWDQLDQIPEQYLDQIPKPWPAAENPVSRAITDIGFGEQFTAEFYIDGEVVEKTFEVVQSPDHYDMAERVKIEDVGATVRNLTYEVRRYFHRSTDDPGVIVSRVEPGSKAYVGGVRPYEIITHVNDQPVHNVQQFRQAVAGQEELQLNVRRMTRSRVTRIRFDEPIRVADDQADESDGDQGDGDDQGDYDEDQVGRADQEADQPQLDDN